ncbi:DMT family transporter [Fundidesulfovibrio terrae]|uniref:DMT family transporter n=1 Tax=Fundidesulfovibrio terrae TaxID=2922866 RepID=UPI001FAE7A2D|nr:multidrug efflux SMR transporter [Fundidesulfovibrio terrae]
MAWGILFLAAAFEIAWASGLKATQGFTRPLATVVVAACMIASMVLLGLAAKHLPMGTAYAVWTGVGALGTAVIGIALYGEPATLPRLGCIALIALGVMGLKFFSR